MYIQLCVYLTICSVCSSNGSVAFEKLCLLIQHIHAAEARYTTDRRSAATPQHFTLRSRHTSPLSPSQTARRQQQCPPAAPSLRRTKQYDSSGRRSRPCRVGIGPDGLDERADEARVTAAVVPTLALGRVERRLALPEVGDSERAHVADDLPEREVDARLALALQLGVRDHRERGRRPGGELDVHDLYRFEVQGVATGSRRGFM